MVTVVVGYGRLWWAIIAVILAAAMVGPATRKDTLHNV
jgi:hypothetical protein